MRTFFAITGTLLGIAALCAGCWAGINGDYAQGAYWLAFAIIHRNVASEAMKESPDA